jgi:predicted PurR-regulated permease PerM
MSERDKLSLAELHLWQFRAVQDVFWIGLAGLTLWFGYQLRSIFVPMLIGLGLAYAINPALVFLEDRLKWRRTVVLGVVAAVLLIVLVSAGVAVVPLLLAEADTLVERAPGYFDTVVDRFESSEQPALVRLRKWVENQSQHWAKNPTDAGRIGDGVALTFQLFARLLGITTSIALIPIYACFFAWSFQPLVTKAKELIPDPHRDPICRIVGRMDSAVGDFLRGRFFVMLLMMAGFSSAFWIAGVPYWLLIGCFTGLLSFIPYVSVIGAGVAVLATWVESQSSGTTLSPMSVFGFPLIAFSVVQLLEGWLVTPWIQSKSMHMNPVAIFIVVLVGGAAGGLYGLLLAIPLAGCGRILFTDVLLPRLEQWAKSSEQQPTSAHDEKS